MPTARSHSTIVREGSGTGEPAGKLTEESRAGDQYFAHAFRATSLKVCPPRLFFRPREIATNSLLGSSAAAFDIVDARLTDWFKYHLANTGYFAWGCFCKIGSSRLLLGSQASR